jgi:hypothetical protein
MAMIVKPQCDEAAILSSPRGTSPPANRRDMICDPLRMGGIIISVKRFQLLKEPLTKELHSLPTLRDDDRAMEMR